MLVWARLKKVVQDWRQLRFHELWAKCGENAGEKKGRLVDPLQSPNYKTPPQQQKAMKI